ncbi:NAD(P)-dependent oxidoreductase [Pseudonocardia halophobica]|uniref:NAD(P)-dependent oxidoreductase n=1 Tax=Pseudonocardia halophobica TaxID=29401 RepID=UPI003D8EA38F
MTHVLSMGRMKPSLAETPATRYEAPTPPPAGPERDAWLEESGAKVRVLVSTGSTPVDAAPLEALGPEGYLVNIARGSVVDHEALAALLQAGGLGGAGLDVFADEPRVPEELFGLDTVVLLPHLASGTVETRAAMERVVLENLDRFLADGTLVTPVP